MRYAGRDSAYLKWRCPAVVEGRVCGCAIDNCSTPEYGRVLKVKDSRGPTEVSGTVSRQPQVEAAISEAERLRASGREQEREKDRAQRAQGRG